MIALRFTGDYSTVIAVGIIVCIVCSSHVLNTDCIQIL